MSSEQTTSQIKVVEKQTKPKILKIKNYKKLYQDELKRRKNAEISLEEKNNELEQLKKKLNDNKLEIEILKQNLETKNKELIDLKKTKGSQCSVEGSKYEITIHNLIKHCNINNKPFNTQKEDELAGSSCKNDIECNFITENDIGI